MDLLTRESFPTAEPLNHECPYEEVLKERRRVLGERGISSSLVVAQLHQGTKCPPTHVDNQPTIEWSDFLDNTSL